MVSAVLKSPTAIQASIHIARAFNELRRMLGSHRELAQKLEQLEKRYDSQFKEVFDAIRRLMKRPRSTRQKLPPLPVIEGFRKCL